MSRRRRRREYDTDEFMKFARRIIRRAGERVADGDTADLALLVEVRKELEEIEARAVAAMRERYGFSWTEIGRDTGKTRQAAEQYYNKRIKALAS
jgi:hypothetical protein